MTRPTGRRLYVTMSAEELQQLHAHRGRPRQPTTATAERKTAAFRRHERQLQSRNAKAEERALEARLRAENAVKNPRWFVPR